LSRGESPVFDVEFGLVELPAFLHHHAIHNAVVVVLQLVRPLSLPGWKHPPKSSNVALLSFRAIDCPLPLCPLPFIAVFKI
jgi:hypothetical protein